MNAYLKLEKLFDKLSNLHHLQAIASWDEAVMMPPGSGDARAKALATLGTLIHETITQPSTADLIENAKQLSFNDPWQKANLEWIEKKYLEATCIPSDLVRQLTEASITCEQAWRRLRADNNWKDFAPLLERTLSLVREASQIRSQVFNKSPYDVLLDEFSPGVSQKLIDPIFNRLKAELPNLIDQVIDKQKHETTLHPTGPFAIDKQKQIGIEIMQALGFDFNHGRLDVSHHPFCGGVPLDVRLTTRYLEQDFISSLMAICHETGHARYEQDLPRAWLNQPVGHALGMAVHESQSLLVEMHVCRSHEFMKFLTPLTKKYFGENKAFTPENLYQLNTRVARSLIRVDADEVTYPLHVILRYEIEKELIAGTLKVTDLPDAWHNHMMNYLALPTKDDFRNGVMQDVHWPSGTFGYFPAYTLGNLIAAQLFAAIKKAHPSILNEIGAGNFTTLFEWLKTNIHSKGSSLKFSALLQQATGEELNPEYFITHIKNRYL